MYITYTPKARERETTNCNTLFLQNNKTLEINYLNK
jgi:hypothetical protein